MGMETGNHKERMILDNEEERIGKFTHARATHFLESASENNRKLFRTAAHSTRQRINFLKKAASETRRFAFIPILGVDQLRRRSATENDYEH